MEEGEAALGDAGGPWVSEGEGEVGVGDGEGDGVLLGEDDDVDVVGGAVCCFESDERMDKRDERFVLTNSRARVSASFSEHRGAPFIALSIQL